MKCPKCKGKMKTDIDKKRYVCEKCKYIINWFKRKGEL